MIVYTFVGCPGNLGARPRTQAFPKNNDDSTVYRSTKDTSKNCEREALN